jgi:hypothetical protein
MRLLEPPDAEKNFFEIRSAVYQRKCLRQESATPVGIVLKWRGLFAVWRVCRLRQAMAVNPSTSAQSIYSTAAKDK